MAIQGSQDLTNITYRQPGLSSQDRSASFDAFEDVTNPELLGDLPAGAADTTIANSETAAGLTNLTVSDGEVVALLGYYSVGDGGGQYLVYDQTSESIVDGGFVFSGPGGVGRFLAIDKGFASCKRFGARDSTASDQSEYIQAACDAALANGCEVLVDGYFRVSNTINFKAAMRGIGPYKMTPSYTAQAGFAPLAGFAGDYVILAENMEFVQLSNLLITAGTDVIGIKTTNCNRYRLERVTTRLCNVGMDLEGFIGDICDCFVMSCTTTGLILRSANSVTVYGGEMYGSATNIEVVSGDLVKFYNTTIEGATGTNLVATTAGSVTIVCNGVWFEGNSTHININGIHAVTIQDCYFGGSGATQRAINISNVAHLHFDNCRGQQRFLNTSGIKIFTGNPTFSENTTSSGGTTFYVNTAAESGVVGSPLINIVPNPTCKGGPRGWSKIDQVNASVSEETGIIRRRGDSAYKCTDAAGFSRIKLHFPNQSELSGLLPGNILGFSAWMYLPTGNTYLGQPALNFARHDNGVERVAGGGSAQTGTTYLGKWQFICGEMNFSSTGIFSNISLYISIGDTVSTGQSIYLTDLCTWIGEGRSAFHRAYNGNWIQTEKWGKLEGAILVNQGTGSPTDNTVPATIGDRRFNTSPTGGGFIGWVCTATGAPGTWKTYGGISS